MNKDQQILYQVAFKGAVELVANGVAEPETEDIAGELIGLTDILYEGLSAKTGIAGGSGKGKSSGSKKPSRTSRGRGSSGPFSGGGGNFKYASDAQHGLIEKLLDEKAHDVEVDWDDSTFEWDGDDIPFGKVPSGKTQEIIGYLIALDDA